MGELHGGLFDPGAVLENPRPGQPAVGRVEVLAEEAGFAVQGLQSVDDLVLESHEVVADGCYVGSHLRCLGSRDGHYADSSVRLHDSRKPYILRIYGDFMGAYKGSRDAEALMKLILGDGVEFSGASFGALAGVAGEVVFNTGMAGYVETLTDPSYRGQILVLTYPLIGNYGVPGTRPEGSLDGPFESDRIQVQGLIVQNYVDAFSHHDADRSLAAWLRTEGVPAATGVDTRTLTRHLRAAGTMKGRLIPEDSEGYDVGTRLRETDMHSEVFRLVAPAEVTRHGEGAQSILLVDVGAKDNIVRSLVKRGISVIRAPWHHDLMPYYEEADGVLIGNGPGDPSDLDPLIAQIRQMLAGDKPVMGICLGNQILARAAGATTFKLPYGHRGVNQPVQDLITRRCFITSQNHGYAVDHDALPDDWEPWFINLNDGSNEGIRSKTRPFFGVQFHPEAHPGPEETAYLFDEFVRSVRRPAFA